MTINAYLEAVNQKYKSGIAREHAYRTDLENLLKTLVPDVNITNEPANVTDCGNPDYVITSKGHTAIPIGYIEAKDIGKDLNSKSYKEQFTRYKNALDNLIITDYVWFQFFQNGQLVHEIRLGELQDNNIKPSPENFQQFESLIQNFCTFIGQTIKSPQKLAELMAGKARLLQNILANAVTSDEETQANTALRGQLDAFQQILINDIKPKEFADIYAQTLAYGMFAARLHDPTLGDFSRQEAAELIPKSNPFLRKLFQYIAGYDIDARIKTTVDNLAEVFRATDIKELLKNFGKSTQQNDPIIHFYETFLAAYDPKLRKSRGVWYTPEPVVNFIVRAVDDILKTEFGIKQGLADTSTTKIKKKVITKATADRRSKLKEVEIEQEVHRVQILDPATGTGTFLAEVIKHIYNTRFKAMQGAWSGYVENHLIPRLNGFELLMASYAMAHLKLDLLLKETGYRSEKDQRFRIYLTNSLEPSTNEVPNLFMAQWLTEESIKANEVKQDTPVMCVIGNPPYAVSSTNKGEWIQNLIADYKKDLKEKTINSLSDDYVKFIRYGQYFIDKNGEGILAYISNNSFLDGIIHRKMRESLINSFTKSYIINLHGDSKKKEVSPDGSKDENVFDIMQGVSINIFVKKQNSKSELGQVFSKDLFGSRKIKYDYLSKSNINQINWKRLNLITPEYFFTPKDFSLQKSYDTFFQLKLLFTDYKSGIETKRDKLFIDYNLEYLKERIEKVINNDIDETFIKEFNVTNSSGYNLIERLNNTKVDWSKLQIVNYRPFEKLHIYYDEKLLGRSMYSTMKNLLYQDNIGLVISKQCHREFTFSFISNKILDGNYLSSAKKLGGGYVFPLYLYIEENQTQLDLEGRPHTMRTPNLDPKIVQSIADKINLTFTPEKEDEKNTFASIDILDYIYAVLHSPGYREKYKEFLKIDFPRVPYPKDTATFWALVKLGTQIRQIHLLESPTVEQYITSYPKDGDNIITRKLTKTSIGYEATSDTQGRVWINDEQYFDNVPLVAWEFYIGGYQPAQKWLKDRKGRTLDFDDILHYQKIIVALSETDRLMKEIDTIDFME